MNRIGHKFGGSSVASAACISQVAAILLGRDERQIVVISAMRGVTDALIALVGQAAARADFSSAIAQLKHLHQTAAHELLGASPFDTWLDAQFGTLAELLHAQSLVGAVSDDLHEAIVGLGEVWSSRLVAEVLRAKGAQVSWLDARDVLVVEKSDLGALVDWSRSSTQFAAAVPAEAERVIVTGFVARTPDGRLTTLGRNGSDYSASIFASLAGASELHLWSDVDGVLSADPRVVPEAVLINHLSYSEACELAYFGAKVIHPQTMAPAIERSIPIIARNTFNPTHPGTRITAERDRSQPVKGVTTFSGLAILNIEGAGMIGVPGTAERAFESLKAAGISVVMISQGSSEHSICCVIQERDAAAATRAVRAAFARELDATLIHDVTVHTGVAVLAVVGDGMAGTPGVAARLFASLGRARINVRAIAQGASERNISVAIDAADARRALRAVHAGFYLSPRTLSIGVIGPGNVGRALIAQIAASRERLKTQANLDLRVRAIAGSRTMALGESMLALDDVPGLLAAGVPTSLEGFANHVHAEHLPQSVIIDCSASGAVADHYDRWLQRGIDVITPNKHAGAGPLERYERITSRRAQFRYESTVGAGLPVITTLRDLIDTGDQVLSIEGIFSGTLAYLFNRFDGTVPFSSLVREAKAMGYTEPDPRDDLSGLDVARKLVILARENGWKTTVEQIALESLVPASLQQVELPAFMARLEELDAPLLAKLTGARSRSKVLRYVARLDSSGAASVGLIELPEDHAFAHIRLTDNVVQFTTRRYRDNPLVVQGPGAGPEVTAAGVFADLLRVASSGART